MPLEQQQNEAGLKAETKSIPRLHFPESSVLFELSRRISSRAPSEPCPIDSRNNRSMLRRRSKQEFCYTAFYVHVEVSLAIKSTARANSCVGGV